MNRIGCFAQEATALLYETRWLDASPVSNMVPNALHRILDQGWLNAACIGIKI